MATDHDALVVEWAADQLLNPLDPVDYFVKDADGNYEPVSGSVASEPEPEPEPEVAKTRTTTTKK